MGTTQELRVHRVAGLRLSAALAVLTTLSGPAVADSIVIVPEAPAVRPEPAPITAPYGYVVQISSQRSEAEALAAFGSMQSRHPRVLGDREPIIRRVDLGSKGVYYFTFVGPFETAGDANQFCRNLKTDNLQCVVRVN